jgi:hypothetical protein
MGSRRMNRCHLIVAFDVLVLLLLSVQNGYSYSPFWDFRGWRGVQTKSLWYNEAMDKFSKHGITVIGLMNKKALPPFEHERKFLQDATKRGVGVWLRTNRVSPKRGIPGKPNGNLDFALDLGIQNETLDYLDKLAALSKEYPSLKGIIIGGEELVGAHISQEELDRHDHIFFKENGFHLAENLTDTQKIIYFDWIQEKNNNWYAKIWDTLHPKYPDLELIVFPSWAAVVGYRYSRHPRPAYWDIHDLIVTRNKTFSILVTAYVSKQKYKAYHVAAIVAYLGGASDDAVPIYVSLQGHKTKGSNTAPKSSEMEAEIFAAITAGADGVGYYPIDQDAVKSTYFTNKRRWNYCFDAIEKGRTFYGLPQMRPNIFILKPRYSQYWKNDNGYTLQTFAALYELGFTPGYVLEEEARVGNLPKNALAYYIPETYKCERREALDNIISTGKPVLFGMEAAERHTESQNVLSPLYTTMGVEKNMKVTNLISNAGFEQSTSGQLPKDWENSEKLGKAGGFKWDDSVYHHGKRSVKLECDVSGQQLCWVSSFIKIDSHQQYQVWFWRKMKSVGKGNRYYKASVVRLTYFDQEQKRIGFYILRMGSKVIGHGTSDWKSCKEVITAPEGTRYVTIGLYLNRVSGTVWYDDIKFFSVSDTYYSRSTIKTKDKEYLVVYKKPRSFTVWQDYRGTSFAAQMVNLDQESMQTPFLFKDRNLIFYGGSDYGVFENRDSENEGFDLIRDVLATFVTPQIQESAWMQDKEVNVFCSPRALFLQNTREQPYDFNINLSEVATYVDSLSGRKFEGKSISIKLQRNTIKLLLRRVDNQSIPPNHQQGADSLN